MHPGGDGISLARSPASSPCGVNLRWIFRAAALAAWLCSLHQTFDWSHSQCAITLVFPQASVDRASDAAAPKVGHLRRCAPPGAAAPLASRTPRGATLVFCNRSPQMDGLTLRKWTVYIASHGRNEILGFFSSPSFRRTCPGTERNPGCLPARSQAKREDDIGQNSVASVCEP